MWRPYWAVSVLAVVAVVATADLSGTWDVDVSFDDPAVEGGDIDCVIKQDGEQLKGHMLGRYSRTGRGSDRTDGQVAHRRSGQHIQRHAGRDRHPHQGPVYRGR